MGGYRRHAVQSHRMWHLHVLARLGCPRYLLEQEELRGGGGVGGVLAAFALEDRDAGMGFGGTGLDRDQRPQWAEVHDMRPRWRRPSAS